MSVIIISALWCNACLYMKKTFKAFQEAHPEIEFKFLDLDMDDEVENYSTTSISFKATL